MEKRARGQPQKHVHQPNRKKIDTYLGSVKKNQLLKLLDFNIDTTLFDRLSNKKLKKTFQVSEYDEAVKILSNNDGSDDAELLLEFLEEQMTLLQISEDEITSVIDDGLLTSLHLIRHKLDNTARKNNKQLHDIDTYNKMSRRFRKEQEKEDSANYYSNAKTFLSQQTDELRKSLYRYRLADAYVREIIKKTFNMFKGPVKRAYTRRSHHDSHHEMQHHHIDIEDEDSYPILVEESVSDHDDNQEYKWYLQFQNQMHNERHTEEHGFMPLENSFWNLDEQASTRHTLLPRDTPSLFGPSFHRYIYPIVEHPTLDTFLRDKHKRIDNDSYFSDSESFYPFSSTYDAALQHTANVNRPHAEHTVHVYPRSPPHYGHDFFSGAREEEGLGHHQWVFDEPHSFV